MNSNNYKSYIEYLSAKKTVDDRALNKDVWNTFCNHLKNAKDADVLEIGSGIGTMITRILDCGNHGNLNYQVLDMNSDFISETKKRIENWTDENNYFFNKKEQLCVNNKTISFKFESCELNKYLENKNNNKFHIIIANAFLDLVNIPEILPKIFGLLYKGGMFYFTINFDGRTDFEPVINKEMDTRIIELYHRTMDERIVNGVKCCTRYAGKLLFNEIIKNNGKIIDAGSSDWIVFSQNNKYKFKEDYFLHFIINTIQNALKHEPELPEEDLKIWIQKRHDQIDKGELIFITHQIDFFGTINV